MTSLFLPKGHPSDSLGAILTLVDHLACKGEPDTVKDIIECMIEAHKIQAASALLNSFNCVNLDHIIIKVALTASCPSSCMPACIHFPPPFPQHDADNDSQLPFPSALHKHTPSSASPSLCLDPQIAQHFQCPAFGHLLYDAQLRHLCIHTCLCLTYSVSDNYCTYCTIQIGLFRARNKQGAFPPALGLSAQIKSSSFYISPSRAPITTTSSPPTPPFSRVAFPSGIAS